MVRKKRHEKMLHMLNKEKSMTISNLSNKLNTTMMTIRRDLDFLEEKGFVKRFHGGVMLTRSEQEQPSFYERYEEFSNEKYVIGLTAAKLISKDSVVFFDAGTTPLAIVEHIPIDLEFTAVTTGLLTAVALCEKPMINVISVGGNIHHTSFSSVSRLSVDFISQFNADIAFISTRSISLPEGIFESHIPLIEVKEAIVNASKQVVLVADNSKFGSKSLCRAVEMNRIDLLITDSKTEKQYLDELDRINVRYTLAKI